MQFLDSAGVRQFKQYNDSKYVVTEDVSTIDTPARDTYTKDEIDNMLDGLIESETDPIFTASAASGITSNDITNWNGKQDSISDLAAIRSGAALGATSVQTETDPTVPAWAKAATKPTYTAAEVGALPASTSIPSKTSDLTNDSGYIDTETDPVFSASVAAGITSSDITNWNSKTSNTGTITGITMNGASKGTSGVVDLGTVITAHQDISGKADKSAAIGSLSLSLNSTDYKITLSGTKVDGTTFTVSDVIDLPLESVVVNGSYDDTTKKVVLTLKNGNTVDFSIADLIAGLQSEITSTNKLSADLIADGTTNKVVTATEKSTWNGKQDAISDLATIRSNAEAGAAKVSNVQSDWNATSGLAQILNKPTIPADNIFIIPVTKSGTAYTTTITRSETQTAYYADKLLFVLYRDSDGNMVMPLRSYDNDDYGDYYFYAIRNNHICSMHLRSNGEGQFRCYYSETELPSTVTESTVSGWGFTKNTGTYSKPSGGIPKTDLASAVQTSLGKADTALQSYTETDPVYSASAAAGITSSDISNWNSKTSNVGTITGITMNGSSKGTSGVVDLGTVITSHATHKLNATNGTASAVNQGTEITYVESVSGTTTATSGDLSISTTRKKVTIPTAVTESTVSGWGFTKNSGTVTGVKMNGTTKTPTSGTVDLGTVITSETSLSKGTTTGSGNAVTDISVSGHTITLTKGSTFLTSETQLSKGTTSGSGNVVTDLSVSGHTVTLTKGSNVPVATSANAGKIPMITSSGGWEYVTPSAIYSGSATPNNNTGNNGDIYLQTS